MSAELHMSTGAMALDALPADEATAFAEHLADCPTCAEEFRGLQETAALLGAAEAVRPPAALRDRVLEAAARTPQLPPIVLGLQGRHRSTELPPDAPVDQPARSDGNTVVPIGSAAPHKVSWLRRPTGWLAAAAAVVVIAGGVTWAVRGSQTAPPTASQQLQQCVTSDSAAKKVNPNVGTGGSVDVSTHCLGVVLQLPEMAAPPAGKAYQIWKIDGGAPQSEGLVNLAANAPLVLPIKAEDAALAVTVEPAGGSKAPTTAPIWAVRLT
ncbi:MAG: anti-sigma factor [Actinomycetota bacterium]|nr:anti-sigma factor [Actinomycetota bacterium]